MVKDLTFSLVYRLAGWLVGRRCFLKGVWEWQHATAVFQGSFHDRYRPGESPVLFIFFVQLPRAPARGIKQTRLQRHIRHEKSVSAVVVGQRPNAGLCGNEIVHLSPVPATVCPRLTSSGHAPTSVSRINIST